MNSRPASKRCLECDRPLAGENFCPQCGQATTIRRITFRETIADFLGGMYTLEAAFPRTLVAVYARPARLFRDYLAGKRKRYYKAVPFFIVCTAIYLLLGAAIGYDPLQGARVTVTVNDELTLQELTPLAARFMVEHINHILLFLVFTFGLVAKALFPRRHHLAEYVAIGFFVTSAYIFFGTFTMLLAHYWQPAVRAVNFIALIVYVATVFPFFLNDRRWHVWVRSLVLAAASVVLYVLSGFGFSMLWVATFGP